MKKVLMISAITLVIAAGLLTRGYTAPAVQETISGDWTAKVKQTDKGPVLWLSLNRNTGARKGRFQMSSDFPLQDFAGLNPNANSNVQFTLGHEAGTVFFDGLFKDGRGVGDFKFTPNSGFIAMMRNLGYDDLTTEKLFTMAVLDVSTNFINELKSIGYDKPTLDQLIGLRALGVTVAFAREAQDWGFGKLSPDELIEIKAMGINPDYIRSMKSLGFDNLSLKKVIELKALGVNEDYVKQMRSLGFENIPVNKLIEMKAMGITADYVKKMRALGLKDVSINELIQIKATGADKILAREKR
ncbi:MAG TPA: hypothetical protein VE715_12690 [Blastocatellia bacterium]|nr:hypothetical protein [Blastocatellia bacterium]